MKDIFILNSIFVKEMTNVNKKIAYGEMTNKEGESKNKFFNKAITIWEKVMDLFMEGYEAGSKELDKKLGEFEQLLKNEGLL
jgi:hypothetical protein